MSLCIIFFKFPITIKAKTGYFIIEYLAYHYNKGIANYVKLQR